MRFQQPHLVPRLCHDCGHHDGHGGGDWRLVNDWLLAISKKDPSLLTSTIDQSIESHIMGFMAEKSRKTKKVMDIKM